MKKTLRHVSKHQLSEYIICLACHERLNLAKVTNRNHDIDPQNPKKKRTHPPIPHKQPTMALRSASTRLFATASSVASPLITQRSPLAHPFPLLHQLPSLRKPPQGRRGGRWLSRGQVSIPTRPPIPFSLTYSLSLHSVANMLYNRFADAGKTLADGDIALVDVRLPLPSTLPPPSRLTPAPSSNRAPSCTTTSPDGRWSVPVWPTSEISPNQCPS